MKMTDDRCEKCKSPIAIVSGRKVCVSCDLHMSDEDIGDMAMWHEIEKQEHALDDYLGAME